MQDVRPCWCLLFQEVHKETIIIVCMYIVGVYLNVHLLEYVVKSYSCTIAWDFGRYSYKTRAFNRKWTSSV